jgi:hypothetical protein
MTHKLKKTLLFMFFCMLLCISVGFGCRGKGVETIWAAETKSPDGRWLAKAQTDQRSGFGTDGAVTAVYLQPSNGARSPVLILAFSQNQNAQTSLIDLKMKWVDGKHLEVSYKEHPNLDFQAIKYAGIDISVRDLSDGIMSSPQ